MLFDTRPSWKFEPKPGTSSSPGSSADFVPWKNGPSMWSQCAYVTGMCVSLSSITGVSRMQCGSEGRWIALRARRGGGSGRVVGGGDGPVVVGGDGACLSEYGCPGDGAGVVDGDGQLLSGVSVVPGPIVGEQVADGGGSGGPGGGVVGVGAGGGDLAAGADAEHVLVA